MDEITFLTYGDVVESGVCLDGVISVCKKVGVYFGEIEVLKTVFKNDAHLLRAAKLDGDGDGDL